jgi:hypothetical protein
MYPKIITEKIIELQAKGFSAEETRSYFQQEQGLKIGLNTVYRPRKSVVGQEIADEMVRTQQRSILKQEEKNPALAMKYRNELLKLLIPQRIEQKIEGSGQNWTVTINDNSKRTDVQSSPATT